MASTNQPQPAALLSSQMVWPSLMPSDEYDLRHGRYLWEIVYGNLHRSNPRPACRAHCYLLSAKSWRWIDASIAHRWVMTYNNGAWTTPLRNWLRHRFPNQSSVERHGVPALPPLEELAHIPDAMQCAMSLREAMRTGQNLNVRRSPRRQHA